MIQRKYYLNAMQDALSDTRLLLLLGTRQVGKTTLMKQFGSTWTQGPVYYCNIEDYLGLQFTSKQEFVTWIQGIVGCDVHKPGLLLLDEIQSVPHIETLLKTLYDDDKIITKIIATGSRFWGQSVPGSTLVGRGATLRVYPLSFREFLDFKGKSFDQYAPIQLSRIRAELLEYIQFGGYPAVVLAVTSDDKITTLSNIIMRIFEKDFSYFFAYNEVISCKKVFERIIANTGSLAKIDAISEALGIGRDKVKKYIHILQESYLIYAVYPYYTDLSKEYGSKPKLYIHDTGLFTLITGKGIVDMHDGRINESIVLHQLLRKYPQHNIYYYRKKHSGSEIDFVINRHHHGLCCIEAKSQDNDTIPKIFFEQQRSDGIHVEYTKTTASLYTSRTRDHITCKFSPRRDLQLSADPLI